MLIFVVVEIGMLEFVLNLFIIVEEIIMVLEIIVGVARATWRFSRVVIVARVGVVVKGDIKFCVVVGGYEWRDIIIVVEFMILFIKFNVMFFKFVFELMRVVVARREGST